MALRLPGFLLFLLLHPPGNSSNDSFPFRFFGQCSAGLHSLGGRCFHPCSSQHHISLKHSPSAGSGPLFFVTELRRLCGSSDRGLTSALPVPCVHITQSSFILQPMCRGGSNDSGRCMASGSKVSRLHKTTGKLP